MPKTSQNKKVSFTEIDTAFKNPKPQTHRLVSESSKFKIFRFSTGRCWAGDRGFVESKIGLINSQFMENYIWRENVCKLNIPRLELMRSYDDTDNGY